MANPRTELARRLDRAVDHIEARVDERVALGELARIAGYSPYHFHRLFSAYMHESPAHFGRRLRIERAAAQLLDRRSASITDVALEARFASSATFARAFRERFDSSARTWRAADPRRRANASRWTAPGSVLPEAGIDIVRSAEAIVGYIRHRGAYAGRPELFAELFDQLRRAARSAGMWTPDAELVTVYHDAPGVTAVAQLRISVGVVLSRAAFERHRAAWPAALGRLVLPASTWIVGRFVLAPNEYPQAWNTLYAGAVGERGLAPTGAPALERYPRAARAASCGRRRVDLCVPVERLAGCS